MKQRIKVLLSCILISQLFLMTVYAKPDWPSDTGIQAEAGIVIDADSGAVIFGQNIHAAYPPASITKILTALIVLENSNLSDTVTFSKDAVYNVEAGSGNKLNVTDGDKLSVEDCLYSLLLHSCNQAANALAEHVAGSREEFIRMMNDKIAELGCTESHFDNPSGLNGDTQYVTAYDMALIAREAYNNEKLVEISSSLSHKVPPTINNPDGFTIYNEHRLVKTTDSKSEYYYPPAVAGKTGYLIKAGNTLVTYAEKDGRRLISVILKGKPRQYFIDGKNLLKFGFDRFKNIPVSGNETGYDSSDLELQPGCVITLPREADFSQVEKNMITDLPVNHPEGAESLIEYMYNDRKVGQAYLIAKNKSENIGKDSTEGKPEEDETQTDSDDKAGNDSEPRGASGKFVLAGILGLLSFAGTGAGFFVSIKRKEARKIANRREERRKRLKANGDEEAFDQLLKERRESKEKNKG